MDFGNLFGKMGDIQAKMKEVQDNLEKLEAHGEAGAGMVKARVNGKKKVTSLEIDPDILKSEDKEMVQDLSIAAINIALENIEGQIQKTVQEQTQGLIPNIPGFDIGNMFR